MSLGVQNLPIFSQTYSPLASLNHAKHRHKALQSSLHSTRSLWLRIQMQQEKAGRHPYHAVTFAGAGDHDALYMRHSEAVNV